MSFFAHRARFGASLFLLAPAALGLLLAGCGTTVSSHHVQSARARVAPAALPALNLSDGDMKTTLMLRLNQGGPASGKVRTATDTGALEDTVSRQLYEHVYYSRPGNYVIDRANLTLGADFQTQFNRVFDVFLTIEVAPTSDLYGTLAYGMGLTLPLPGLRVRVAPSASAHHYRMNVVDSIVRIEDYYGSGSVETEEIVYDDRDRLGFGLGGSLSVWMPRSVTGIPFTPFLQFQVNHLWMKSSTLPDKILGLDAYTFGGGFDYELDWGHLQGRFAREMIGDNGWRSSYRAQGGIAFKIDP